MLLSIQPSFLSKLITAELSMVRSLVIQQFCYIHALHNIQAENSKPRSSSEKDEALRSSSARNLPTCQGRSFPLERLRQPVSEAFARPRRADCSGPFPHFTPGKRSGLREGAGRARLTQQFLKPVPAGGNRAAIRPRVPQSGVLTKLGPLFAYISDSWMRLAQAPAEADSWASAPFARPLFSRLT